MNHRVESRMSRMRNHSPPPKEIKAKLAGSVKSCKTASLSDSLSVECDSVVSEVTLDAAFDKPSSEKNGQCNDAKFLKNVVVASGDGTSLTQRQRQQQVFARQESVSKLDGSDFFKGKFKSAFHKELSNRMSQKGTDGRTEALNKVLEEKKKAIEKANLERQISNARLDDLPANSLLSMFTSTNLASGGAEQQPRRERPRRRSSHTSSAKQDRAKATTGQDIVFDPQPDDQDHASKPTASSQGIAIISSTATNGYIPPPRIEDLEAKLPEKLLTLEASEIIFNPKDSPDMVESEHAESKAVQDDLKPQRRQSSKHSRRRSSDTSATRESRKATAAKATSKETTPRGSQVGKPPVKEIPKDIPECITIGEDHEFEVSGLMDIPEDLAEFVERGKEKKHSRHHSSSHRPRKSHADRGGSLTSATMSGSVASTHKSKVSTKAEGSATNLSESQKTRSESKRSSRSHSAPSSRRRRSSQSGKLTEGKERKSRSSPRSGAQSRHRRSQSLGRKRVTKVTRDDDVNETYRNFANNKGRRSADTPTEEQHPYVELQEVPSLPRPPDLRRTSLAPDNGSSRSLRSPNSSEESVKSPVPADEFDAPVLSAAATPARALWKRLSELSTSQRMGRRHTLGNDELQTPRRTSQDDSPDSERSHRSPWSRPFSSPVKSKRKSQNGSASSSSGSDRSLASHLRSHPSPALSSGGSCDRSFGARKPPSSVARPPSAAQSCSIHELLEDAQSIKSDAEAVAQDASSKSRSRYTPTVVHGATEKLSYSDMFMQGKIEMSGGHRSVLKPTPEGSSVSEF